MLGQDIYTDPSTGLVIAGDADAYARASESLVEVNALLADMRALVAAQWAGIRTLQDAGGNDAAVDALITDHADVLTDIDAAEQAQAELKTFVDRYRFEVLGSGLAGLGWIVWVFALLGTIASWVAWLVTARQRTDTSRLRLQQTVADAVSSGTITADQGQTILSTPATGGGDLFGGMGTLLLAAGLAYMLFMQGGFKGSLSSTRRRRNPWRFYGAFTSPRKAAARRGEIPGAEVKTYRMKRQGTRHVVRKWEKNPPADMIPGYVEEIRYQRTGAHPGPYKHKFTSPVAMKALKSGGVLLSPVKGRKKLWVDLPD